MERDTVNRASSLAQQHVVVLKGEAKVARNDLRVEHNGWNVEIDLSDIQFLFPLFFC